MENKFCLEMLKCWMAWIFLELIKKKLEELEKEAKTVVFLAVDNEIKGLLALQDIPKENAKLAISQLKKRGLKTVMLTGDNAGVARAIADQIGIEEVIAGVLPEEKAHEIHKLQASGKVAFVGDGINDAPALSVADVGIAMGAGTDIAIESADLVLTTNNLLGVVRAFDMSKKTFHRILLNLFWAFIYNVAEFRLQQESFQVLDWLSTQNWQV